LMNETGSVCGITLNLKNFKGLEGKIYCAVHTPVSRSTATADAVSVQTALSTFLEKFLFIFRSNSNLILIFFLKNRGPQEEGRVSRSSPQG
jgi:hypothetical protein